LPVFALLLFVGTFVAVILRTWLPSRRAEMERLARLPLDAEPGSADRSTP